MWVEKGRADARRGGFSFIRVVAIQSDSAKANETKIKAARQLLVSTVSRVDFPEKGGAGPWPHPRSGAPLCRGVNEEITSNGLKRSAFRQFFPRLTPVNGFIMHTRKKNS